LGYIVVIGYPAKAVEFWRMPERLLIVFLRFSGVAHGAKIIKNKSCGVTGVTGTAGADYLLTIFNILWHTC
jgi:hypothetical protein